MQYFLTGKSYRVLLIAFCLSWLPVKAFAHGGVVLEEDRCVINIGFLKAHFTLYQPESEGSEEFCEDVPNVEESIFVMDYLHDYLKEMAVDFRIIRDVHDFGTYAKWEDIARLEDIESTTVFYQVPTVHPDGVYKARYGFKEKGGYIGIVTATHPNREEPYRAVFYFQVGGPNYGYLPLFAVFLVLAQGVYWLGKRRTAREATAGNSRDKA